MTAIVVDRYGRTIAYPSDGGAGGAGYLVGPSSKGAPYQSLSDAVAAAVRDGAAEPVFYLLTGGDYSDAVVLPANSSVVGVDSTVTITGPLSTAGVSGERVRLENVAISASGHVGVTADYRGVGPVGGQLALVGCSVFATAGGTGLSVAGCLCVADALNLTLSGGLGLLLTAGDAGDDDTTLGGNFVNVTSLDDADVAARLVDGAGGSDNIVLVRVDLFAFSCRDTEAVGIDVQTNVNPAVAGERAGLKIGRFIYTNKDAVGGSGIKFTSGFGIHHVAVVEGDVHNGTVIDSDPGSGHAITVDDVSFPRPGSGAGNRGDFVLAHVAGGIVVICNGYVSLGSTAAAFTFEGGAATQQLQVFNVNFDSFADPGGRIVACDNPAESVNLLFGDCRFTFANGNPGAPYFEVDGDPGAVGALAPQLALEGCTISAPVVSDAPVISLPNASLRLSSTVVTAANGNQDVVDFPDVSQPVQFTWRGHSTLSKAPGTGVCLRALDDANMTLQEAGELALEGLPDQLFDVGAGANIVLDNLVGARPVAQGSMAQLPGANVDVVGDTGNDEGPPSVYPYLHVTGDFTVNKTGTVNNNDADLLFQNEVTGHTSGASATADVGNGVRDYAEVAFANRPILVAGGQACSIRVQTATDDSTDYLVGVV